MAQRIRYNKTAPTSYETTTHYSSIQGPVKVVLNLTSFEYSLVNIETQEVVSTGQSSKSTLVALKNAAKLSLLKHGVVFKVEKRTRLKNVARDLRQLGINV